MKKQGFILGSFILIASVIVTKIIGLLFKIPLANILGGTGMGYFSCAYAIFMPVYAVCVTGLPAAVSKMVAENMAYGRYSNVRKIKRIATTGFAVIGALCTVIILVFASPFTKHVVGNAHAYPAVLCIAPCIFFGALLSVYRGYYEGMRNMIPTAVSQIVESTVKLLLGLGFSYLTLVYFDENYNSTGKVLGKVCSSAEEAQMAALPYVAAAAIAGVTLSSAVALIYMMIRYHFFGDGITKQMLKADTQTDRRRVLIKQLALIVVPIALGSVVTNLTSLIDLATIINILKKTVSESPEFYYSNYGNLMSNTFTVDMLPNFIYGSFTGLAITVFNLVPSVTNMFGKGVLPNLAEAWTICDEKRVAKNVNSVIGVTCLIAIPAGVGISVLAKPILNLLYSKRPDEIEVVWKSMQTLGIGVIFLALSVPAFAMLQAIGRADLPVKIMALGIIIKLVGNIVLINNVEIGVNGAAIATGLCYFFICIVSLRSLRKLTGAKLEISRLFVIPGFASILCGGAAYLSYDILSKSISDKISCILAIVAGGAVYLLALYLMDAAGGKKIRTLFFK